MGRKALSKDVSEETRLMDAQQEAQRKIELDTKAINEAFSDGKPYERLRIMDEAGFYAEQADKAFFELGKRLLLLKANEEHGVFIHCLEQLDIPRRTASHLMAVTAAFGSNGQALAHLGVTKLSILARLDKDELQDFVNGRDIPQLGIIDDVDAMPSRELEKKVRELKAKQKEFEEAIKAKEAIIAQKEEKINELDLKLLNREPLTKKQLAEAALKNMNKEMLGSICMMKAEAERVLAALDRAHEIEGVTPIMMGDWLKNFNDYYAAACDVWFDLEEVWSQRSSTSTDDGTDPQFSSRGCVDLSDILE